MRSDRNFRLFFLHFAFIVFMRNKLIRDAIQKKEKAKNFVP